MPLLAAAVLALMAACGGGGGEETPPPNRNGTLNGSYRVALYYSDAIGQPGGSIDFDIQTVPYIDTVPVPFPASAFSTELVTVSFDGAGNYSMSGTRNQGGVQSPISGSGTYLVAMDGTLTLDVGFTGGVISGGSMFVLAALSGEPVGFGVGVIRGGAFSNATLNGSYKTALYYSDASGNPGGSIDFNIPAVPYIDTVQVPFPASAFSTELVTLSCDGAGNYSVSGTRNQGGVQSPVSGSGTYVVAADGALTFDIGLTGSVLADGSTFVLASTSGEPVEIGVGVLQGGTFGNATLNGTYRTTLYYSDADGSPGGVMGFDIATVPYIDTVPVPFPASAFNTELVRISFDGAGSYSMSGTRSQGGFETTISGSGTYVVAADGTLTLDIGLTGSVLADGSTFVLATTGGQPVEIGVGILE